MPVGPSKRARMSTSPPLLLISGHEEVVSKYSGSVSKPDTAIGHFGSSPLALRMYFDRLFDATLLTVQRAAVALELQQQSVVGGLPGQPAFGQAAEAFGFEVPPPRLRAAIVGEDNRSAF